MLNTTKKKESVEEIFAALNIKLEGEDFGKITSIGQDKYLRIPVGNLYDGGEQELY